ncbi:MAG: aldehyde dehydrogenase [Bacteroidales bacterium]|jgi:acyl-CoA reductase-like NAD-dependent aldehyde dehydrogenase|nr:aldehyde dehydrogenase [Bacteroidales bacterium]MCK9447921.1 aldehyde dehydrogenase [Bacteroidales bacterium]MDD3701133.1 aldehyde dehydrogenase [Bacteroidales bacterium]MDY0368580.1 aldehyde dehydrogenase [Bacteroidales bacterium]
MNFNEINQLFKKQQFFFASGHTKSIAFRRASLRSLQHLIRQHEADIIEALRSDLGKPPFEAYATEIGLVLEELRLHLRSLQKWSKTTRVSNPLTAFPAQSFIMPEPYGNTLIISPWNYPFQLVMAPLIAAISAGNCAIIKPSEISTHTSQLIYQLINNSFPEDYLRVVTGDSSLSASLTQLPFDLIFFTGSTHTGKKIMKAAAENLSKVILELGGKSPVIVDAHTNISLAAKRIMWGKLINAGQSCIAPDHVWVHHSQYQALTEELIKATDILYPGGTETHSDYARIINQSNIVRLSEMIRSETVIYGGQYHLTDRYFAPTIVTNPAMDSVLMQEEIFGPVLPLVPYSEMDEPISWIRQQAKPLAAYLFSNNSKHLRYLLNEVDAGGITINDTLMHFTNTKLPFGGIGNSGQGTYHGKAGFETFSHPKAVMKRARWLDIPLRYPPYGNKLKLIKKLLR